MKGPSFNEIIEQNLEDLKKCPHGFKCTECPHSVCVTMVSAADFPSKYGHFQILGFVNNKDNKDHIIILKGNIDNGEDVLMRLHSACLTGDALGSLRCDCGPQLHEALKFIEKEGRGLILYHQEEGRGIGLVNKLRAYALQDNGLDTLDANTILGFAPDARGYEIPAAMLKLIGVKSVRLMTNNPHKVEEIRKSGITVNERIQHELPPQIHNEKYMKTKKDRFDHMLNLDHQEDVR
ncbi:MAG: GTP cyclohydrolase II [Spirochaetes bacterium]|nr:GTP cyclohydrolase II [Spirochaetota bacterium]